MKVSGWTFNNYHGGIITNSKNPLMYVYFMGIQAKKIYIKSMVNDARPVLKLPKCSSWSFHNAILHFN